MSENDTPEATLTREQWEKIPHFAVRQDSLSDQMFDLISVANRLGMYDASEFIGNLFKNKGLR